METDLTYYRRQAREKLTRICGVYPVCDGDPDHLCTGQKYGAPIGLGGAGQAKTFEANYSALQQYPTKNAGDQGSSRARDIHFNLWNGAHGPGYGGPYVRRENQPE